MRFVDESLTRKVFKGSRAGHVLSLRNRRPDLWTLPLTCENTNTLMREMLCESHCPARKIGSEKKSMIVELWGPMVSADRAADRIG